MATEESDKRVDMTILCVIIKSGDGTQCEHDLFIVNSSIQLMVRVRVRVNCNFSHWRCFAFLLGANRKIDRV